MSRRSLLLVAVIMAAATIALAGCGGSSSTDTSSASTAAKDSGGTQNLSGETLVFAGFGGSTQEAQEVAWTEPFADATGVNVEQAGPVDYSKIKVQMETGNVEWDAVDADAFEVAHNCGTLFEKLPSSVDRSQIKPNFLSSECGVPAYGYSIVLAYDKKKFANDPPTSWKDFFNLKKYPGKRGIWNYADTGQFEAALLADGVPPDELYPLDLNRAVAKLETIKSEMVFTATLAQLSEQLVNHNVAMSLMWNARGYDAFAEGAGENYAIQWNQNIRGWDDVGILKGTPHLEAATAFANFVAQPAQQAAFTQQIVYAPLTKNTHPKLDKLQEEFLPTTPEHFEKGIDVDQDWWGSHFDEANSVWTQFVSG